MNVPFWISCNVYKKLEKCFKRFLTILCKYFNAILACLQPINKLARLESMQMKMCMYVYVFISYILYVWVYWGDGNKFMYVCILEWLSIR